MGTPLYMSPEQVRSAKNVDLRTDIWALGVILYELVAGIPPFVGSAPGVAAAIVTDDPPPFASAAKVPVELMAIIQKAMQKKPADRFSDARQLASALAPFGPDSLGRISVVSSVTGPASNPELGMAPTLPEVMGPAPPARDARAVSTEGVTANEWASGPPFAPARPGRATFGLAALLLVGGGVLALGLVKGTRAVAPDESARIDALGPPSAVRGLASSSGAALAAPIVSAPVASAPIPSASMASGPLASATASATASEASSAPVRPPERRPAGEGTGKARKPSDTKPHASTTAPAPTATQSPLFLPP